MKARRVTALATALALAACAGRGVTPSAVGSLNPAPQGTGSNLIRESFTFLPPAPPATTNAVHHPLYVTAAISSVQITLDSVNGGAPSTGVPLSVITNLTITSCPCTVYGPSVPPGSDTFTLTAYDQPNASGNLISTATPTYTIAAGQANNETVTLNGVPARLFVGLTGTSPVAGTPSTQSFSVTAFDSDGYTIMGTYSVPITLSDSDTSGATSIVTSGGDNPPANQLLSSSDSATLNYNGLAIGPATIGAVTKLPVIGGTTFTPTLQPMVYTGLYTNSEPAINLFGTSGSVTASSTFTVTEVGWTNAPFNKSITLSAPSACASFSSTLPAAGTSFTSTLTAVPTVGSCTLALTDFTGGQIEYVALAYFGNTSQTFTYNGARQYFYVPNGVSQVTITIAGAQGGSPTVSPAGLGGLGGSVTATLPINISSGSPLDIDVGGAGTPSTGSAPYGAGFNGGGGTSANGGGGGGGGGMSDVVLNGAFIIIGAGGGGGANAHGVYAGGDGGPGGGTSGLAGTPGDLGGGSCNSGSGGGGGGGAGTAIAGGAAGDDCGASPGSAGQGGNGLLSGGLCSGGGGGAGSFGGGGGGTTRSVGIGCGGGGGGSSAVLNPIGTPAYTTGTQTGNGQVVITW